METDEERLLKKTSVGPYYCTTGSRNGKRGSGLANQKGGVARVMEPIGVNLHVNEGLSLHQSKALCWINRIVRPIWPERE